MQQPNTAFDCYRETREMLTRFLARDTDLPDDIRKLASQLSQSIDDLLTYTVEGPRATSDAASAPPATPPTDTAPEKSCADAPHTEKEEQDSGAKPDAILPFQKKSEAAPFEVRVESKAQEYCTKIKFAVADGNEKEAHTYEQLLLQMTNNAPFWQEEVRQARRLGALFYKSKMKLDSLLAQGVTSPALHSFWKDLRQENSWKRKVATKIAWKAQKEIDAKAKQGGSQAARELLAKLEQMYGTIFNSVTISETAAKKADVRIVRNTQHVLFQLEPAKHWDIYIDETGSKFSDRDQGKEGRMVAVCIPQDGKLPALNKFHATDTTLTDTLNKLNILLQSRCGVFGLTRQSLAIKGDLGWQQLVMEMVKWILRLLPFPEDGTPVTVNFHVEQRGDESANDDTESGQKMLATAFARENPERSRQLQLLTFEYVSKSDPMIAWADVMAYLWNSGEGCKALRSAGLLGTSLVDVTPAVLEACECICTGGAPSAQAWQTLVSCENALDGNRLTGHALTLLQKDCQKKSAQWQPYVYAMQEYLVGKRYMPAVLENMASWLHPMQSNDPRVYFYWHLANLARLNHQGDVASSKLELAMSEVSRLAPEMRKFDVSHEVHAQLRLAVADSNAFDFVRAETRLARWNPLAGGTLTESDLWDGKLLSSLGQYRAFQRDNLGAINLFEQALACFSRLASVDSKDAQAQSRQTQTYLAIASMDCPAVENALVRARVLKALDHEDMASAIKVFVQGAKQETRYSHHLLVRYLASRGTPEERQAYLQGMYKWTVQGQGVHQGHPWPQITYHRWLLVDRDDSDLKKDLCGTLGYCLGPSGFATMDIICFAIAISMGVLQPDNGAIRGELLRLAAKVPHAEPVIQQMLASAPGDALLARRLLPFNYC